MGFNTLNPFHIQSTAGLVIIEKKKTSQLIIIVERSKHVLLQTNYHNVHIIGKHRRKSKCSFYHLLAGPNQKKEKCPQLVSNETATW